MFNFFTILDFYFFVCVATLEFEFYFLGSQLAREVKMRKCMEEYAVLKMEECSGILFIYLLKLSKQN